MKVLTVDADVKHLNDVIAFLEEVISPHDCPPEVQFQLEMALEEIYVNIAYYAYPEVIGPTIINAQVLLNEGEAPLLVMDIMDRGTPYNPLEHKVPDLELDLDDRDIGGLGIFLVKDNMDAVEYRYEDSHNVFQLKKYLSVAE